MVFFSDLEVHYLAERKLPFLMQNVDWLLIFHFLLKTHLLTSYCIRLPFVSDQYHSALLNHKRRDRPLATINKVLLFSELISYERGQKHTQT
jgi:predicted dithiol-disulfide oxidoreductase (DUF899 family)